MKKFKLINNILFYGSVLYTIAVLGKTYFDRAKLPEGVCPLQHNNTAIYIGIGLLIVSFISSTVVTVIERQQKISNTESEKEEDIGSKEE